MIKDWVKKYGVPNDEALNMGYSDVVRIQVILSHCVNAE
jgi:hypothetical protein